MQMLQENNLHQWVILKFSWKRKQFRNQKQIVGTEKQHEKFLKIARTAQKIMEKVFWTWN